MIVNTPHEIQSGSHHPLLLSSLLSLCIPGGSLSHKPLPLLLHHSLFQTKWSLGRGLAAEEMDSDVDSGGKGRGMGWPLLAASLSPEVKGSFKPIWPMALYWTLSFRWGSNGLFAAPVRISVGCKPVRWVEWLLIGLSHLALPPKWWWWWWHHHITAIYFQVWHFTHGTTGTLLAMAEQWLGGEWVPHRKATHSAPLTLLEVTTSDHCIDEPSLEIHVKCTRVFLCACQWDLCNITCQRIVCPGCCGRQWATWEKHSMLT